MQQGDAKRPYYTFGKKERISSKIVFQRLLSLRQSLFCYPFKCYYEVISSTPDDCSHSIAIAVPKRNLKKAVDRNRIKRLTREAYRLNKRHIWKKFPEGDMKLNILFVYIAREIVSYSVIEKNMKELLDKIVESVMRRK